MGGSSMNLALIIAFACAFASTIALPSPGERWVEDTASVSVKGAVSGSTATLLDTMQSTKAKSGPVSVLAQIEEFSFCLDAPVKFCAVSPPGSPVVVDFTTILFTASCAERGYSEDFGSRMGSCGITRVSISLTTAVFNLVSQK